MKTYFINEIFFSLQGEGLRAGTANLFLRFGRCNLRCRKEKEGFDCDTEFLSGKEMSLDKIIEALKSCSTDCKNVILTGGEPALQIDSDLIERLKKEGYFIAIETNGTRELPQGIDWICVSPKTHEDQLRQNFAHELKYVRSKGMELPKTKIKAEHYLLSPAFDGDLLSEGALEWCIELAKNNPPWRVSVQQHKQWKIR